MRPLEEREVTDYRKSAQEVLDNIGGADNVVSAAHCATRLRLVIADNTKVNKEALENVDGAKGVFEAQGQLQIIFGTGTVNKVYEEFIALSGVEAATKAEVKEAAAQQQNIFMRAIKVLGDVFVPIIPAIVASGLLLGIMSALNFMASNGFIALDTNNFIYKIADLVSGTSFGILQILIGYSAAKAFGANPYLGAVVGGAFINSSLQSAYTVASEGVLTELMGLNPEAAVTGIHQMYTAIDLGQLAQYSVTYWLPIASVANIVQGGAALVVAFKTRDAKIKGLALPSALSAFMGITEPAIFGVNLRFLKPFIAGCIGGGCGALVCALTSLAASGTGVTGIFGILLRLAQPVQYAIMFAVAALVSFAVSFVLYKDEPKASEQA